MWCPMIVKLSATFLTASENQYRFLLPTYPSLKYFTLWMQVLFSSQSAHRHRLVGYPVKIIIWWYFFFSGFQRMLFAAALQKSPFTSRSLQQITFFEEIPQIIQLKNSGRTLYPRFIDKKLESKSITNKILDVR